MKKILIALSILAVFGLLVGGVFLFSGVSSVTVVGEDSVETVGPIIRYGHCPHEPGYPDDCHP